MHDFPQPPLPWKSHPLVRSGGLVGAGFADDTDMLLVVTHDGRGVIDCLSGTLIARDSDPDFPLDEDSLKVAGIGPLAGQQITIAGEIYGGSLLNTTNDGWALTGKLTNSSNDVVTLAPPPDTGDDFKFTDFIPEIRVFGFSPTGRSFIIGTGADVSIFAR